MTAFEIVQAVMTLVGDRTDAQPIPSSRLGVRVVQGPVAAR
jgi:hypothetical protein